MLETPPGQTLAVVVGIDHYEYGEDWRLVGPAADALRCVDWLIERGVPVKNIALFLSGASWEDAKVAQWVAERKWPDKRRARRDEIVKHVDRGLKDGAPDAQALFLFWGGHGVVDDYDATRYLYTEDAVEGSPYCISVADLMGALHGVRFERFVEQVLVVDTCANAFSDTGEQAKAALGGFTASRLDSNIKQFQMYAASTGRLAANESRRETGLFSEALFKAFAQDENPGWPEFDTAFERVWEEAKEGPLSQQQPYLVDAWPGRASRQLGQRPGSSSAVRTLQALIANTVVPPKRLYLLYQRSLPDPMRSIGLATIEKWLRDLDDKRARDENLPSPLIQFAERLARDLESPEITAWVDLRTRDNLNARQAMRDAFDAEARARRERATLFIEADTKTQTLSWWVQAPDARLCSLRQSISIDIRRTSDFAATMATLTADAERMVGNRYDLMVALILPEVLLMDDLASVEVPFDDEGLLNPQPLNIRYPVTLHCHVRARAKADSTSKFVNSWRKVLDVLGPRIAGKGTADVLWLEQQGPASNVVAVAQALLKDGICIGLGHVPPVADGAMKMSLPKEIQACLTEGVPCFFWLAHPPEKAADARAELCKVFARQEAREAPLSIGQLLRAAPPGDPLSSVRIVWDEPCHLPSNQAFENPSQAPRGS